MILVVADTSPLNYLQLIGCIDLLPRLFDRVVIPPAVHRELQHSDAPETVRSWAAQLPSWVEVHEPAHVREWDNLQRGETEAIALAQEVRAAAILLDERAARQTAQQQGLRVTGTLGLLEAAAERDWIELPAVLEQLQNTNFKAHPSLIQAALARHAERQRLKQAHTPTLRSGIKP